jgi:hypothetical protein
MNWQYFLKSYFISDSKTFVTAQVVYEGSQDGRCCISIHNEWTEVEAYWNTRTGKRIPEKNLVQVNYLHLKEIKRVSTRKFFGQI